MNNSPELRNPMGDMILGNMPGLPEIIQNSMPVELPRASFKQNPLDLFFGNLKRGQLVKAGRREAELAEYSNRAVKAKLDTIHEVITFSSRVTDTLGQYEHAKTMRGLEIQEKEADIYIKNAQARQMGFEANLSELDYNIKLKQYKKMEAEND
jgi:hypothetical protein